mmetsp:Transcript_12119/g.19887  ORF Transcript_12119/g.19887 Transcript_12119/m.19887 type:complete len:343 (+) Transcript_12119:54-1082(+)
MTMWLTPPNESSGNQVVSAVYRHVGGEKGWFLAAILSQNQRQRENVVSTQKSNKNKQPTNTLFNNRYKRQREVNTTPSPGLKSNRALKLLKKLALSIVMGMYVIHPLIMLTLFRSPELFSLLGVFQIYHKCSGMLTRRWNACLEHAAMNIFLFFPSLGGIWLWFQSRFPLRRKLLITFSCLLGFKILVDHAFLFRIPSNINLEGKVAVITGANRGIGFATSVALAELGAHCVVTCRSMSKCQYVVKHIQSKGGKATAAVLDLNSLESAMLLSKYLSTEFPTINYFFANAGTTPQFDLTAEGFENAFGSQYLAHMAVGEFIVEFDQILYIPRYNSNFSCGYLS